MGESQNGCFKKTKHAKFSEKRTFLTPWYAHVKSRKVPGSGNKSWNELNTGNLLASDW